MRKYLAVFALLISSHFLEPVWSASPLTPEDETVIRSALTKVMEKFQQLEETEKNVEKAKKAFEVERERLEQNEQRKVLVAYCKSKEGRQYVRNLIDQMRKEKQGTEQQKDEPGSGRAGAASALDNYWMQKAWDEVWK